MESISIEWAFTQAGLGIVAGALAYISGKLWARLLKERDEHSAEKTKLNEKHAEALKQLAKENREREQALRDEYDADTLERLQAYQRWADLNREAIEQDTKALVEFKGAFDIYKMIERLADGSGNE